MQKPAGSSVSLTYEICFVQSGYQQSWQAHRCWPWQLDRPVSDHARVSHFGIQQSAKSWLHIQWSWPQCPPCIAYAVFGSSQARHSQPPYDNGESSALPRCLDAWAPNLEHLRISNGNFNTEHRERDWHVDDECPFAIEALQVEHLTCLKELELVRLVVPSKALRNLTQLKKLTSDNLWEKIEELRDLLEHYRLPLLESLFVWILHDCKPDYKDIWILCTEKENMLHPSCHGYSLLTPICVVLGHTVTSICFNASLFAIWQCYNLCNRYYVGWILSRGRHENDSNRLQMSRTLASMYVVVWE